MQNPDSKTCPFCKETIRLKAVKCRFCGEWLESPVFPESNEPGLTDTTELPTLPATQIIKNQAGSKPTPNAECSSQEKPLSEKQPQLGTREAAPVQHHIDSETAPNAKSGAEPAPLEKETHESNIPLEPKAVIQDDLLLGEKVFRDLTESLSVYPSCEQWEKEFLAQKNWFIRKVCT